MKREAGFTLLEVLIALTVMAVGVALTMSLISGSLGNIRKVRVNTRLIEDAQTVMENVLLNDAIQGATSLQDVMEDGTRWSVQVSEVEVPPLPSVMPASQQIQALAPKLLSYVVVVMGPNSVRPDYQLQTLKLISPLPLTQQGGRVSR
jgi:prepilin-type N-terminal cleavage/methylation domain-containing protein